jgi:hypothetical protein
MALILWLLASAWSLGVFAATPETPEVTEQRRVSRLVSHLKRLEKPEDWLLVRKFFSSDSNVQLNALSNCPLPENEWPWYLSSDHLKNYAFSVDFIPLNMDSDKRLETLMVIQSDHAKDHYITFCLMDDDKSARKPLASYSDLSRGREITYQIADLTADGSYELIVNVREGSNGHYSDAVRVIKPIQKKRFELVWFARLREELRWPRAYLDDAGTRAVQRSEDLRAKVRFRFNGPGNPATLILKGVRKYEEQVFNLKGGEEKNALLVDRFPFEEFWRWDKKKLQFVRVFDSR